jgi:hypothetical protein
MIAKYIHSHRHNIDCFEYQAGLDFKIIWLHYIGKLSLARLGGGQHC